jgi:uncharacterized oxidoreductase
MTRHVDAAALSQAAEAIFRAAGSAAGEARAVAAHLVEANLVGHESHGVIRIPKYVEWLGLGEVVANAPVVLAVDRGALAVLDGGFGYGQVVGLRAVAEATARARAHGFALVAARNSGHLGRIGAWAEQLAEAGLVSVHFVNTSGYGILVAPHGGTDRRLSANPVAAGAPNPGGAPFVLDIATSVIAEGKIQVARNKGERLPDGAALDGYGRPTADPAAFYGPPPGAILPFGGHKGSGLSFFCEILAGSLTGGHASNPQSPTAGRLVNNMLTLAVSPDAIGPAADFAADVSALTAWVKGSPPAEAGGAVLLPGEIEARTRAHRLRAGVPLDAATWSALAATARGLGVALPDDEVSDA